MQVVAVTGISGYIGQRLLRWLDQSNVSVIGIDLNPPFFQTTNLTFYQKDIRDPSIQQIFLKHNVETIIHLAFLIPPFPFDAKTSYDINVNGTRNILQCSKLDCVKQFIYTSSGIVYSLANKKLFTEEDCFQEIPGLDYGQHKIETEKLISEFKMNHPEKIVTIFRPSPMIGPHAASCVVMPLKNKWMVAKREMTSRIQYIHEEDVCGAIVCAWRQKKEGAFNLGADEPISFRELFQKAGVRFITLPTFLFRWWYMLLWKLKITSVPANMMEATFNQSLIMDTTRLKTVLNYTPRYTTTEAVASFLKN